MTFFFIVLCLKQKQTIMMFFSLIRSYWRGILISLCIIYLSSTSPSNFEKISVPVFEGLDKTIHFLMYFGLAIACTLDFRYNKRQANNNLCFIAYCIVYPFLLGGILEIVQWQFIPLRAGSLFDILANGTGIAIGYLVMKFLIKNRNNN